MSPISRLWAATAGHTSRYPLGATTLRPDVASGLEFRRDTWGFLERRAMGVDAARFTLGFTDFVLVNSPSLVRDVLVGRSSRFGEGKWTQRGRFVMGDCLITREGSPHRERRTLLQPAFQRSRLASGAAEMVDAARRMTAGWRDGATVDASFEMARIAVVASALAMFAVDLSAEADALVRDLRTLIRAIPRPPFRERGTVAALRRVRRVAERIRGGPVGQSLADLPEEARIDELVSLLIASIDTTPGTLAASWLALGRHAEVEERLHAELARELGGREPETGDLARLDYLRRVLCEVLRLDPPVHFVDRRALERVDLGPISVDRGEYILLSPLLTHRDPRYHDRPEEFRPERWTPENRRRIDPYAYFPFGAGTHACIGMGLADQEISLVVASLAQRWRLRPGAGGPGGKGPRTAGIPMTLESRS